MAMVLSFPLGTQLLSGIDTGQQRLQSKLNQWVKTNPGGQTTRVDILKSRKQLKLRVYRERPLSKQQHTILLQLVRKQLGKGYRVTIEYIHTTIHST